LADVCSADIVVLDCMAMGWKAIQNSHVRAVQLKECLFMFAR
jgi:hypothetical protein